MLAAREKNPGIKLVCYEFGILCIISLALSLGGIWLHPIKQKWAALRHLIADISFRMKTLPAEFLQPTQWLLAAEQLGIGTPPLPTGNDISFS